MTSFPPELPVEAAQLIEQKKFAELENLWTARAAEDPKDLPFFLAVAAGAKKKGAVAQAADWLRLLAGELLARGDADAQLDVLSEIARMFPTDEAIRPELERALRVRFASHPALAPVLAQNPLVGAREPAAVASKIRRWLAFQTGGVYFLPGRGPGHIVDMNPTLDVIRVQFADAKLPFSLVSAERSLVPLPEGHFLREKLEKPDEIRQLVESEPAEAVRRVLESFGRSLTLGEVKEHFGGVVPEAKWGGFWAAARRHKQLLVKGTGKSAVVSWTDTAGAADDSIWQEFEQASPARKIDLARKHGKRSAVFAEKFARDLRKEAREAAQREPALAWELSQAAARLQPAEPEAFPAEDLLAAGNTLSLLSQIGDQGARTRALEAIRARREDWEDLFSEQFLREDDQRVLAAIFAELPEERRADLSRRVLRSPRTAARAFVWLCESLQPESGPPPAGIFFSLCDALRQEEFSGVRARLKEFFDPGGLAVVLVRAAPSEDKAREMIEALNRAGGLEEHRRATVREALLMKFPELRAPAREWLYATPEAIERQRKALHHLKSVELPANAEAMKAAKDLGDLSENFEYHSARQRHEYLSARIAALADELSRARPLDPAGIDATDVRVGTKVALKERAGGSLKTVTILGPWDSRPEELIYSYQSEFAQQLLGRRPGESVRINDVDMEIVSIVPWR